MVRLKMTDKHPNFKDFMLSEYSNIAQAHFKSIETISTFFRYYLLIMSIPISAVAVFFQIARDKEQILIMVHQYKFPLFTVLICISFIGVGIFSYITNLRLDTILYARVVNGIRKVFYDKWDEDINLKLRVRTLPQSAQLPHYFERSYFSPVVLVFGLMNSLYFFLAFYLCFYIILREAIVIGLAFVVLHLAIYSLYSRHRERAYLKSNILGIDIDGVLNRHRDKFCELLYETSQKTIKPDEIKVIPVHENGNFNITRGDERQVFNEPSYWKEMYVIDDAAEIIRKLKNSFKLKVYIFTYRPWPDNPIKEELIRNIGEFVKVCGGRNLCLRVALNEAVLRMPILGRIGVKLKERPLKKITKQWLKKYNFKYDKFIFEKGNDHSSDPRGQYNNRFYIARRDKIRFFVEDDIEKAIKLSYICDVVFLICHPYNESSDKLPSDMNKIRKNIPSNIIRVNSWDEISRYMRRLS